MYRAINDTAHSRRSDRSLSAQALRADRGCGVTGLGRGLPVAGQHVADAAAQRAGDAVGAHAQHEAQQRVHLARAAAPVQVVERVQTLCEHIQV